MNYRNVPRVELIVMRSEVNRFKCVYDTNVNL